MVIKWTPLARKSLKDTVRLCTNNIMTRDNLKLYQYTYAEKMVKYGLERSIKGSGTRHIFTPPFYRDLYAKNEDLKEDIKILQEQKEEVYDSVRDLHDCKNEAQEKFLDMYNYIRQKEKEITEIKARLEQLLQEYESYKALEELNIINKYFPIMKEQMRIVGLCEQIRLTFDSIRSLLFGKTLSGESVKFYSPDTSCISKPKTFNSKSRKNPITSASSAFPSMGRISSTDSNRNTKK
ncbi:hypothetical protein [Parabacteroides faecis]|uniref:Uncharacterized protein n=1 Tax=Parabacteroides faecis TaxID=1217282 RepID=A0ABR6KFF9_9BACT|nr:hypothetical protein [Parabacteroides faecis]MBB4620170.1 hypothetical protein [Parabacteroides faecis]GGJ95458.1 hypothetical protein GCM10007084_18850 [Parabacteroides faecis]